MFPKQRYAFKFRICEIMELRSIEAVEFLLGNGFCLNSLYNNGVHYLSREEETIAIARAAERYGRTSVRKMIDVKETEHDSLAFLEDVRHLVDDWLALGQVDYL